MQKIIHFIILTRPLNVFITFLTIFVAAGITGPLIPFINVIFAAISASVIMAGANVVNDYYDVEIDKINKPNRLLPAGKISRKSAWVYFTILLLSGWVIAALINLTMFLVAFFTGLLLFIYSYKLKRTVLLGNIAVSLSSALAFIFGGMAVGRLEATIYPAVFGFLFHFGREIIKDIQDMEGDKKENAATFPIKYGIRNSLILTILIFSILILVTVIPYIVGVYGLFYIIIVMLGVHTVLIYVSVNGWENPTTENFGRLSTILKVDMFIGLLAVYVG